MPRVLALLALLALATGCAAVRLARYAVRPDAPSFQDGAVRVLDGLRAPVEVAQRPDGLWRIAASHETDALLAQGYLQARDRLAQMDLFRHLARGELAAWIGNRAFGDRTTLDVDRLNRFLGFREKAVLLYERTSKEERAALDAFVQGVNRWIDEQHLPLEHRLLGVASVRAWTVFDSLSIYQLLQYGLASNADREIRRLAIACAAGLEALERIWPTDFEFASHALPDADLRAQWYPSPPAVLPELAAELPARCAEGRADGFDPLDAASAPLRGRAPPGLVALADALGSGWSASNNWAVSGAHTASGRPILSSDPHLPHANPPLVWGVELSVGEARVAGFTFPGLHRIVFGHNGHVAWGATTNHVDRQDLLVLRGRRIEPDGVPIQGYELDETFVPFEMRTEVFAVRGGDPVRMTVRFTRDGPLVNDLEPFAARRIPLTALHGAPLGRGADLDAARLMTRARTAAEFEAALDLLDLGCASWVFADAEGSIAFRSPCLVPIRSGWRGTFPAPGWSRRFAWHGFLPKSELPSSTNPARGWLASANGPVVPAQRFPVPYNNDASAPLRFLRIAERLEAEIARGGLTAEASAAIQLDARYPQWPGLRAELAELLCRTGDAASDPLAGARARLCAWDGRMEPDSVAATLYVLWTHAILDRALADELPGGAGSELWRWVQSLLQFEANVAWLWSRPEEAVVWDDARTLARETRQTLLEAALADAVAAGRARFGSNLESWRWGRVRPFALKHPFASQGGGLGALLNSEAAPAPGDTETVFKQQFLRSDREAMQPIVGPVVRLTVDLGDPWAATYCLAGGESGWPGSPAYGNLLDDWRRGRGRPLTPPPSPQDVRVRFMPRAGTR